MEFVIKISQFLLSLSLLIILHELGHFIPAKAFKTRVEKFYLFFDHILKPGERSAIMVQNSPQNYAFKERGENYEIAFFYLKVTNQKRAIHN